MNARMKLVVTEARIAEAFERLTDLPVDIQRAHEGFVALRAAIQAGDAERIASSLRVMEQGFDRAVGTEAMFEKIEHLEDRFIKLATYEQQRIQAERAFVPADQVAAIGVSIGKAVLEYVSNEQERRLLGTAINQIIMQDDDERDLN